jgi:hypothetical protein
MKKIIGLLGCGVLFVSFCEAAVFFYQEPGQYVMAQAKPVQYVTAQTTNSEPAVKPVLDISGIKEIQSIPVGEMRSYWAKDLVDEGEISMEQILDSIANLAVMQMGLEKFTKTNPNSGEVIIEGEFGRVLKEILGFDPEREFDMSVEHTDFTQTDLGKEDYYRLTINCRDIDLILRDFGTPGYLQGEYGYDWGIAGLTLTQYSEKRDARGIPYTEERELLIHPVEDKRNPGRYKFVAIYTVRTLAPDGTVVEWEEWEFAQGSPKAIDYRKIK